MSAIGKEMAIEVFVELDGDVRGGATTELEFGAHEDEADVRVAVHRATNLLLSALPIERLEALNSRGEDEERQAECEALRAQRRLARALERLAGAPRRQKKG